MKIWVKTVSGEKITRSYLYEADVIDADNFETHMQEVCHAMDVPTPLITRVNVQHFTQFNVTKFRPRDFVESIDFDYLEVEFVPENRKKTQKVYFD